MNITMFEQALLKAAKVALYHIGSIFLMGIAVYLMQHQTAPVWFTSAVTHVGIPVALINSIWAGIEQALQAKLPPVNAPQS